ncbi:MAG: CinA family protein [Marmoricola sp.]
MEDIGAAVHAALRAAGATVACAESITGGDLAGALTAAPGGSQTFRGGVVSYATEVKRSVLGVTAERVISAACAEQMASGVRTLCGADWGISTTGVAGPTEQEGRPVGTVYVGIAGPGVLRSVELNLDGERPTIQEQTCLRVLAELEAELDAAASVPRESPALG